MPSNMKLSPGNIKASQDMGHALGHGRSSTRRQTSDAAKEKVPLTATEKSLLLQNKHKGGHSFGQPYLDLNYELRHNAQSEKVSESKPSKNDRKSRAVPRACDDYELVKHMSNLPGFLQRIEKESSIQEKALNFGVLDWKRLEKWKYIERMPGKHHKKTSLGSNSFGSASGPPKMVPNLRNQPSSHGPSPGSLFSRKQPMLHGSRFSSPQRQPLLSHSSHLNSSKEVRNASYYKEEKYVLSIKSKGKETCNQEYQTKSGSFGHQQDCFHHRVSSYDISFSEMNMYEGKRKDPKKEMISDKEVSSLEQGKHMISLPSRNNINAQGQKSEMRFDEEVKFTLRCRPPDPQNIVLLVPKDFRRKSYSESSQFTESRTSLDARLAEMTADRSSDVFCPQELYSGELSADIAHSCPLPSDAVEPHDLETSQAVELDIRPSLNSVPSITSEGKSSVMHEETVGPSSSVEASDKKRAEQSTVKGRAPSPTRRFSFSLGKMSRSFSFKESSGAPQLSSTYASVKSGPLRPEVSSGMDNCERDQANASSRGRSSPLRRLLDPLLKHKAPQSSEHVRPPNGSLRSMTVRTTSTKGPSQDRRPEASTFQALLQLSLKNELPFFKLVVDHSNEMLVAAVKRLPTSEKSDPRMVYAFYSVYEIKKKSMNWINQGSKSKPSSLGYNIVGQMKISNFHYPKVNPWDSSECAARECVLYGVDQGQLDEQKPEFVPSKEIAAVIVRNLSKKLNNGDFSEKDTTVILPSGVHGIPIKGAPSSLISRWRSGGSCDCGGWDIGCKLRILADHKSSSAIDHIILFFVQGGELTNKPVFSLKPCSNGLYSIEFDSSISLLEAFTTCVAYVTCWRFPEIIDAKGQLDEVRFPEGTMGSNKRKISNTFQEQIPAKYVTCPPLSPVGRI
ncbi:hypothetical protein CDL12_22345 [Handroanthus impetiginosus]|uniref:Uncharacterized protein n=1 Tax=Handroanthus impetiginosus TaxID=429701 RepID=A0A2G9GIJ0_9LAMI|nr:hypothetical protein CDL12_22345 [Handroanthus impetiginosus]